MIKIKSTLFKSTHNNMPDIQDNKLSLTTKLCLLLIFIAAGLVGIVSTSILGFIVLCACVPLVTTKDIYLVYPIMIFYYFQFGELFGISVYSLFSLLFFAFSLLQERNIRIQKRFIAPFVIFLLYCIIAIMPYTTTRPIFAIFDMICIMILITHYLADALNLRRFFTVYALIAFVAFFTGTQIESKFQVDVLIGEEVIESVRNCATFEDPNYMGFFYTIAIFAIITLKLFNPKLRVVLVIALYAILFSSLSMTAIIVNTILWALYLVITKKINIKTLILVVLIVAILLGLYSYGKENPDTPIIGMLSHRISGKLEGIDVNDSDNLNDLTTGRSDLVGIHFDYFMNQPVWKMLVGMNAASTLRTDLDGFRSAAHNEYVDWLLNIGIIGAVIMLFFLLKRVYESFVGYIKTKDPSHLCNLFLKFTWIAYAFTLTVYGDFRFLLAFFL